MDPQQAIQLIGGLRQSSGIPNLLALKASGRADRQLESQDQLRQAQIAESQMRQQVGPIGLHQLLAQIAQQKAQREQRASEFDRTFDYNQQRDKQMMANELAKLALSAQRNQAYAQANEALTGQRQTSTALEQLILQRMMEGMGGQGDPQDQEGAMQWQAFQNELRNRQQQQTQ